MTLNQKEVIKVKKMYKIGDRLTDKESHFIISNLNISKEIDKIKGNDKYKAGSTSINSALRGVSLSVNTVKVINFFYELAVIAETKRNENGR